MSLNKNPGRYRSNLDRISWNRSRVKHQGYSPRQLTVRSSGQTCKTYGCLPNVWVGHDDKNLEPEYKHSLSTTNHPLWCSDYIQTAHTHAHTHHTDGSLAGFIMGFQRSFECTVCSCANLYGVQESHALSISGIICFRVLLRTMKMTWTIYSGLTQIENIRSAGRFPTSYGTLVLNDRVKRSLPPDQHTSE